MPIYEYQCKACEHTLDALQKISDAPLTDCPECGAAQLRKLVSAPNFRLKGSGWYETDFKDKNQRNLAGGADKSSSDTKSSGKDSGDKSDTGTSAKADKSAGKADKSAKSSGAAADKSASAGSSAAD